MLAFFFDDGAMAIRARDSFIEMDRRRLCVEGLFAGIAVLAAGFAKGSVLRKACVAGDMGVPGVMGVGGAIWWGRLDCACVVWMRCSCGRAPAGT